MQASKSLSCTVRGGVSELCVLPVVTGNKNTGIKMGAGNVFAFDHGLVLQAFGLS